MKHPKRPNQHFLPTRNPQTDRVAFKVTLGIVPDYSFEGPGLRMDGVSPDKPAQKAGLQAGDVLVGINDLTISGMKDYMQALAKFKKGDTVTIHFIRNGKKESTQATF
jgi:aminopeptidase YwaD